MTPSSAHTRQGFRTTLASHALRVLCKALSVVALARLVSPADHGRFAMAASVFYVVVLFRDLGLGTAAVQARELSEEQLSTLWRAHALLGLAIAVLVAAIAPVVAAFYQEAQVTGLLRALSVGLLLIGLNAWPRVLLLRALRFRALNLLETAGTLAATTAMIAAAALGAGAYAFVVFVIVMEAIAGVAAWACIAWRPVARVRWGSLRQLWRAGAHLTGYNLLQSILLQVDTLLMGRWFGAAALGLYNRPNQLLALPVQHVGAPLTQVMLATLGRSEGGSSDFVTQVRATTNLIAHLTLPFAVVCATLPDEVVWLLFGAKWPAAAPLLRWLALGAAASYLGATVYGLCVATHHTLRLAAISAVTLALTCAALWVGRAFGPVGLAAGMALTQWLSLAPRIWWATHRTPVRPRDFAAALARPLGLAAVLALGCLIGAGLFAAATAPWRMVAGLGGGGLLGAGLVGAWPELRAELLNVWQHRPGLQKVPEPAVAA